MHEASTVSSSRCSTLRPRAVELPSAESRPVVAYAGEAKPWYRLTAWNARDPQGVVLQNIGAPAASPRNKKAGPALQLCECSGAAGRLRRVGGRRGVRAGAASDLWAASADRFNPSLKPLYIRLD